MNALIALICGILFGSGLAVSGMTDTAKVLGFLDLLGDWDPSLAFVMGAALTLTISGYHFILKKERPLFDETFHLPVKKNIDPKLIAGAIFFGIGWGLNGYCPGPALSSVVYLHSESVIFIASMVLGMMAFNRAQNR